MGREPASVKDKAKSLIKRLKKHTKVKFENIFEGVKYKNEVVAIFLAVLELMKLNRITVYEENDKVLLKLDDTNASLSDDELVGDISDDNTNGETNEN